MRLLYSGRIEFGVVGFCGGRKAGEPREKPSEQGENQQHTQQTYIICVSWFSYKRCSRINSGINSYLKRNLSSKDQFILFEQSSCGVNEH